MCNLNCLQVSLKGEKDSIFTEEGSNKVQWQKASGPGRPVSWYKVKTELESPKFETLNYVMIDYSSVVYWNRQDFRVQMETILSP